MGLAIEVGALADLIVHDEEGAQWLRDDIAKINAVLKANGLPSHAEAEAIELPVRYSCTSFPYSFLHYLRRAFAFVREGKPVPDDEELRPEHDAVVEDASTMFDSHLLCHSDCEGYYAPIEFPEPIFDDGVPGGMLGSSQGLLAELLEVAPHIGVEVVEGQPTPSAENELREIVDGGRLWRERLVWYALWEAARISVDQRTLIVFS